MTNTFDVVSFAAMDALRILIGRLPGWRRPVTVRWRNSEATSRWSQAAGEPIVIDLSGADMSHADLVRPLLWPALTRALGSEIWPHIWAKAMRGPLPADVVETMPYAEFPR